ncbi:DUF2567 domain-containing protein [Mycolicibacterium phlei]
MTDGAVPRISRNRAALTVVAALTGTGVLISALWAAIAPPIRGVIALTRDGDRVHAYLGNEGDHFFLAAFLLVGLLSAVAMTAAVWAWQWKAHRGPVMVAALAVGTMTAAGAAAAVGALLVRLRYGAIDIAGAPVTPEQRVYYVTEAPAVFFGHSPLQAALTILFPAAVAALVYSLVAVATPRDDLGAWPPADAAWATPGDAGSNSSTGLPSGSSS